MPTVAAATTDLNSFFRGRINQFQKNTSQRLNRSNPFKDLVDCEKHDESEGANPTNIRYTHELPENYPGKVASFTDGTMGMETIKRSQHPDEYGKPNTGTGNDRDVVAEAGQAGHPEGATVGSPENVTSGLGATGPLAHKIRRGQIERTFEIRTTSFRTEAQNLQDIKSSHAAVEAVKAFERSLKQFVTVFFSDWYRVQNMGMIEQKYGITDATTAELANSGLDYNEDFRGLTAVPGAQLEWEHLKGFYADLLRDGVVDEYSIGVTARGTPVLPLYASMETLQRLFRDNTDVREQVKYHDSMKNLTVMGTGDSMYGFAPMLDLFPIRMTGDGTDQGGGILAGTRLEDAIYPTENIEASLGRSHKVKDTYKTPSNNGNPVYEVVTILPRDTWKCVYEATTPNAFAGMKFDPQDYSGEFRWINNPTFEDSNDRGNMGYYLADVRVGAKATNPDFGISILHQIYDGA